MGSVDAGLIASASLFTVSSAHAMTDAEPTTFTFGCDSVTVSYGEVTLDQDNTGGGIETYRILAVDGDGTVLRDSTQTRVQGTVVAPFTEPFLFDLATPDMNPIRFTLTSLAGNGLDEQVVWDATGACSGLPSTSARATAPASFTAVHGTTLSGDLAPFATAPDSDPLSFALATAPAHGTLVLNADGSFA